MAAVTSADDSEADQVMLSVLLNSSAYKFLGLQRGAGRNLLLSNYLFIQSWNLYLFYHNLNPGMYMHVNGKVVENLICIGHLHLCPPLIFERSLFPLKYMTAEPPEKGTVHLDSWLFST